MRKITRESVNAFLNGEEFNKGNMRVIRYARVTAMHLHGNLIAERVHETGEVFIRDAGWQTVTTKE